MSKLFFAYLARLKKNGAFWCFLVFMAGFGVLAPVIARYEMMKYGVSYSSESRFAWHVMLTGVITALFTAWFLGTEYSDGTIRNKLVAGHLRRNIYLASLGSCVFANLVILTVHMLIIGVFGHFLIAPFRMKAGDIALFYLLSLLVGIAFTSVYTMFVMQNQNKSASVVTCALACLTMFVAAFYIYSLLEAPEMIPKGDVYVYMSSGSSVPMEMMPNPKYLSGVWRTVYEWLEDILPYGQAVSLAEWKLDNSLRMISCSLGVTAGTTLVGLYRFGRKDLK